MQKYNQSEKKFTRIQENQESLAKNDKNKNKNEKSEHKINGNLKKLLEMKISKTQGKKKHKNSKQYIITISKSNEDNEDNKNKEREEKKEKKEDKEKEKKKEEKEEEGKEVKENKNNIENKNQILLKENEVTKKEENEELIENKITQKDFPKDTNQKSYKNIIPRKKFSVPEFNIKNLTLKKDNPNYVRQLEIELEKEKRQRKYYQNLCKELEEKNKELCFQLLGRSINPQNTSNMEIDSNNGSIIGRALENNIQNMSNAISPRKRFRNRLSQCITKDEIMKINPEKIESSKSIPKSIPKRNNVKRESKFKKLEQEQFNTAIVTKEVTINNYYVEKPEKSNANEKSHISNNHNSNINENKNMNNEVDIKKEIHKIASKDIDK